MRGFGGGFGVDGEADLADFFSEGDDGFGGGAGSDFGDEGFARVASVDASVGRDVIVVAAHGHDDVVFIGNAIVSGIETYPAMRRRVDLNPGVAFGDFVIIARDVEIAADVAAGDTQEPENSEADLGEVLADARPFLDGLIGGGAVGGDVGLVGQFLAEEISDGLHLSADGQRGEVWEELGELEEGL